MAGPLYKPVITLGGVPLAANAAIVWRLQTGTTPYQTTIYVHKSQEDAIRNIMGTPQTLLIKDGTGKETKIEKVYVLHEVPTDSPNRRGYIISDLRWRWAYRMIAREFNVTKRTGDRFNPGGQSGPVEIQVTVDEYQYRSHTLLNGKRWTAKQAIEHVLELLTKQERETDPRDWPPSNQPAPQNPFVIESFPIETDNEDGQFTLQNVTLRDQGDVALSRLMSMVPGAEVYVRLDGTITVFDGTDLQAADDALRDLKEQTTWDGEYAREIKRRIIRPTAIRVHYQREMELLLDYEDEYEGTSVQPNRNFPWLENVIPTTDPLTVMDIYDPETGETYRDVRVRQGTYVNVLDWLKAMDDRKPQGSLPWTWDTVKRYWTSGTLDQVWNGGGAFDLDPVGDVSMRIQAFKAHFRQTFRMSRRYVERIREIRNVRVGLLDPVSGARAPAAVWGQACVVPSQKGYRLTANDLSKAAVFRNVDYRPQAGQTVLDCSPGPVEVNIVDPELGIISLQWKASPYGTTAEWYPCHLVGENGGPTVPTRDLTEQKNKPIGRGIKVESGTNGIFLRSALKFQLILTIVPDAPNNARQFHQMRVRSEDVAEVFRTEYRLQGGSGPELDVFIAPGEATARYALSDPSKQNLTLVKLLGLDTTEVADQGIKHGEQLEGYTLINENVELKAHARAVAAEAIAHYADSVQGRVATKLDDKVKLVGNMASTTISVAAAPSGKLMAVYEFPGQQKPISRFALLSDAARQVILGTLPYR